MHEAEYNALARAQQITRRSGQGAMILGLLAVAVLALWVRSEPLDLSSLSALPFIYVLPIFVAVLGVALWAVGLVTRRVTEKMRENEVEGRDNKGIKVAIVAAILLSWVVVLGPTTLTLFGLSDIGALERFNWTFLLFFVPVAAQVCLIAKPQKDRKMPKPLIAIMLIAPLLIIGGVYFWFRSQIG